MESHTYMSDEAIAAVIAANDREARNSFAKGSAWHYELMLNPDDFRVVMYALKALWDSGADYAEAAGDLASSIAESLDVDMV